MREMSCCTISSPRIGTRSLRAQRERVTGRVVAVGLNRRARARRASVPDSAVRDAPVGGDGHAISPGRHRLRRRAAWRGAAGSRLQRLSGGPRLRRHLPGDHRARGRAERADHRRRVPDAEPLSRHRDRRSGDGACAHDGTDAIGRGSRASRACGSRASRHPEHRDPRLSRAEARHRRHQRQHRRGPRPQPDEPAGPHRPHALRSPPRGRRHSGASGCRWSRSSTKSPPRACSTPSTGTSSSPSSPSIPLWPSTATRSCSRRR